MQPRWCEEWAEANRVTFLGGTNDVDLWIDADGDLRLVAGDGPMGWDFWGLTGDGTPVRDSYDSDIGEGEVATAFLYLDLFVPDWKERMNAKALGMTLAQAVGPAEGGEGEMK